MLQESRAVSYTAVVHGLTALSSVPVANVCPDGPHATLRTLSGWADSVRIEAPMLDFHSLTLTLEDGSFSHTGVNAQVATSGSWTLGIAHS